MNDRPLAADPPMPPIVDVTALPPERWAREFDDAGAVLRAGGLVAMATETVFGLFASAADPAAVSRLWRAKGAAPAVLAWHAASPDEAALVLGADAAPSHLRLVRRLCPGPVTFSVPLEEEALAALRERLGVAPGVIDDGREVLVRVPDHRVAIGVISRAGTPVVGAGLEVGHSLARSAGEAVESLRRSGGAGLVDRVLDDGSSAMGRPSTLVRMEPDGGFTVVRTGVYEERYIRKQLARTILFVCTGNTCRSPMAQAIAQDLLSRTGDGGATTRLRSAGTAAAPGQPATPESAAALATLGIGLGVHTASPLTRELIEEADLILGMTRSHVEAVRAMAPGAAAKVQLLDPDGRDIADPIGQGAEAYNQAARAIQAAIERRLQGWNG